jgi:hypothetical protein
MATVRISSEALAEPVAHLVDEMLACYVDWREDATAAADAYGRWSGAPPSEIACRFAAYLAALDQEESAATRYALAVRDLERSLRCDRSLTTHR